MPQSEKFPIGCRASGKVVLVGELDRVYDIPMRVLGYDGLKDVIVETLEDAGSWRKGKVVLMPVKDLTLREEVKFIPGESEGEDGHAVGWLELGDLSVALTRDQEGVLLITLEKSPDAASDGPVRVRIAEANQTHNGSDLWDGDIA